MHTQPNHPNTIPKSSLRGVTDKHLTAWPLAQAMVDVSISQHIESDALLRGTGLFIEDIANGRSLSAKQLLLLSQRVQKSVKSRDAGLQIGRMLTSSHMLGVLSILLRCRNVAHCVELLSQIRWSCMPLIHWRTYYHDDTVYLVPQDSFGAKENWSFQVEIAFAWMVSIVRQGTDKRFPLSFDFEWARPRNIYDYEEFLGTRLSFEQPVTMIKIPREAWEKRFSLADEEWVTTGVASWARQPIYALTERIQDLLVEQPDLTAAQIASTLSMSLATLKRRLAEHNMSFKQLSDSIQKQHAIMMVKTCRANTQQLAEAFSVTDTTNLRRFIKRLTGMTLTQIRNSIS